LAKVVDLALDGLALAIAQHELPGLRRIHQLRGPAAGLLNDVVAVLRIDELAGDLAGIWQRVGGLLAGLDHLAAAEEAEVAAHLRGAVVRMPSGHLGEVGARPDAVEHGLRDLSDGVAPLLSRTLRHEEQD